MTTMLAILAVAGHCAHAQPDCTLIHKVEGRECAYPRLSKDERRILYQSNQDGNWALYEMTVAAGSHRSLTDGAGNDFFPDWSADNQWIAFVSDRDGNEELYLMRTDGSMLRRLTNDPGRDIHPYFSPDGRFILFSSTRGNGSLDIFRYSISSGKTEQLTNTKEEDETCARYAPGMREIVFLKNNAADDDIYVLSLATFLTRNVTNTPSIPDGWPAYSPDGNWIYYSSMESGSFSLYRIRPDGGGKDTLTGSLKGEEDARVCVAPSGGFFVYNKRIGKTIEIRRCRISPVK